MLVFPPTAARLSWRLLPMCLTPEDTLDERDHRDRAPYRRSVSDGFPWNAGNLVTDLVADGRHGRRQGPDAAVTMPLAHETTAAAIATAFS